MTRFLSKPKTIKDPSYLEHVRKACVVHGEGVPVDAHHLIARGMGGKGQKGSDYTAIGMCRECHTAFHQLGPSAFEKKYNINVWQEAFNLLMEWLEAGNSIKK